MTPPGEPYYWMTLLNVQFLVQIGTAKFGVTVTSFAWSVGIDSAEDAKCRAKFIWFGPLMISTSREHLHA